MNLQGTILRLFSPVRFLEEVGFDSMKSINIAINAQVNPQSLGGVESNLFSLLRSLDQTEATIDYTILGLPQYQQSLSDFLGNRHRFSVCPITQKAYVDPLQLTGKWGILRRFLPGILFKYTYQFYGKLRAVLNPQTPAKADQFLRLLGIDVVHFPYSQYFETTLPHLYEPWDLQHRHYPDFFAPAEVEWRETHYRQGCQQANLIVTATAWTKADLIRQYGIAPEKIAVIPRSSLMLRRLASEYEQVEFRERYQLPEQFALYPAMTFPHKNHVRLLQAFAQLRDRWSIRLPLLCTGRIYAPYWPTIEEVLYQLRLEDQVHFLGLVPDEALSTLFTQAKFMVFPSMFEGLGLPLLEAMYHQLPILAARSTCIPEVVAEAGLLFEGQDVDAIAAALREAYLNPEQLSVLKQKGSARLANFSWEAAARTFMVCYKFLAKENLSIEEKNRLQQAIGNASSENQHIKL